jgi:hypothetical protein
MQVRAVRVMGVLARIRRRHPGAGHTQRSRWVGNRREVAIRAVAVLIDVVLRIGDLRSAIPVVAHQGHIEAGRARNARRRDVDFSIGVKQFLSY